MQIDNLSSPYILTADIGGSHLTVAVCNLATNAIQSTTRVEVLSNGSATTILTSWGDAFQQLLKQTDFPIAGLAVAMPGPFDYENGISYIRGLGKYEALYGMDVKAFLADILKIDPQMIRFRNDAESTIAGEVLSGAGKDYQNVMGVTLGTGFGSAHSKNKITKDINLGSDPYKQTIADDYLSTRWFVRRYHELAGINLTGGVKELYAIAQQNEAARGIFKEFAANLSDFLAKPIEQFEPEALIICGNIAKAHEFFLPYLSGNINSIIIKLAQLDENAPLIGAAAMFRNTGGPITSDSVNKL